MYPNTAETSCGGCGCTKKMWNVLSEDDLHKRLRGIGMCLIDEKWYCWDCANDILFDKLVSKEVDHA